MDPLREKIEAIEAQLVRLIPGTVPSSWAEECAGEPLPEIAPSLWQQVTEPARELLGRGGKRWRPLFLLFCAELCGSWRRSLPLTPLVELAHNGSLIVDDIEDRAPRRRGGPAIHLQQGLDVALNGANLMYFLAPRVIEQAGLPAVEKQLVYRYYVEAMIRLHLGQGLDILWHRQHRHLPSQAEYLRMCRLKTGCLARLAAQAGAIAGGGGPKTAELLGEIAEEYGSCFQIIDDVSNLSGGVPGKQRGDDVVEGKKSLPVLLYLLRFPEQAATVQRLYEAAGGENAEAASRAVVEFLALLEPSGCLEEARSQACQALERANDRLRALFGPSPAREGLLGLVETLIRG
jgi:geranylgeranyl pyrophosphate synthase